MSEIETVEPENESLPEAPSLPPPEAMHGYADQFGGEDFPAFTAEPAETAAKPERPRRPRLLPAHTGQSGPFIDLTKVVLNPKELAVLEALRSELSPLSLVALAVITFPNQEAKAANSWVRNSLRRLVRGRWVERIGEGTYMATPEGRLGAQVQVDATAHLTLPPPTLEAAQ